MPNGVSMTDGSSSLASPVDSPRPNTNRNSVTHSRKRSWPHDDEERIRASRRSRQQGLVPKHGVPVPQHFPEMIFQPPHYFPPASQQALAWPPQPDTQFNPALNPACSHIMTQVLGASLTTQGFGAFEPQHSQPMYPGPVLDQPEWITTTMQDGPCSVPPPNVMIDGLGQFANMDSISGSDFIYSQHVSDHPIAYESVTQQYSPPTYAEHNQTFTFDQSYSTHQPPQCMLPTSMPFAPTMLSSSETLLQTDERCECGSNCTCVGCGTHFNNGPTRNLIGNLNSILVKDDTAGQYGGQLSNNNQDWTSPNDFCSQPLTSAEATPGNLPSPAISISEDTVLCEGVIESELSAFAGGNQPKEQTCLPRAEYMTVEYSLDTALLAAPEITDLNPSDFDFLHESLTADFPVGHPLNSNALFSAPEGEFTGTGPIGGFINPLDGSTIPAREVIHILADEDDSSSPTGLSSCCRS
ncbi:hypothetical protein MMC27_002122 [Xylographa pallens]|nr:hypothetical protein [Xylographa pallens]